MKAQSREVTGVDTDNSSGGAYIQAMRELGNRTSEPNPTPISNLPKELGRVRAVYDFEAAEDNELTFKAGELIVLLDDSNENWWRGSNHRGQGLFPAQFVSRELEPGSKEAQSSQAKSVSFSNVVQVATVRKSEDTSSDVPTHQESPCSLPKIDPKLLDDCLKIINSVDMTSDLDADPPGLVELEARCYAMGPLIDPKLEEVDKQCSTVTEVNQRLLDALQRYHELMTLSFGPTFTNAPGGTMLPHDVVSACQSNLPGLGHSSAPVGADSLAYGYPVAMTCPKQPIINVDSYAFARLQK
ncbi:unnamed protein product [Protopolystoma xenopodis]|uniref:SH3 domain-containing protein n=1 Tax=Protopolystoma xenopodis TaxID=117903 RepID=A0A3S5AX15_9PLAT|nr:unnamed protein product [Protopolystoma xenopodis]